MAGRSGGVVVSDGSRSGVRGRHFLPRVRRQPSRRPILAGWQAVYDRRVELGLSQAELAEWAGMTQPQVSRMEGGDTVPTLPLLRRLARALEGSLNVAIDEGESRVTFTPRAV
ncbi:helix-turn-helix domain-containing protein [Streptomyces koyangensis]|uniref:helix-turn-helix domain-containing protein n=1 Tax=Streptomyces koyangensis TaxID=188770 RepID=UPI003F51A1F0